MDNKDRIRYFYEVVTSNQLHDQVKEYVAEHCAIRVGERVLPAGVAGMKQHLIQPAP